MNNRYLEGVGRTAPLRSRARTVFRIVPVVALAAFLTMSALVAPPVFASRAFAAGGVVVALAWCVRIVRRSRDVREAAFARAVLDERTEDAAAECRRILRGAHSYEDRIRAYATLARAAELNGDFVEAADLYALARTELALGSGQRVRSAASAAALAAREAFAHAAEGDAEASERALDLAARLGASTGTEPLVLRARAVTLARRKQNDELAALLGPEADAPIAALDVRDRALVLALRARSAGRPAPAADDDVASWIERVLAEPAS
jgi:hypothetical protein